MSQAAPLKTQIAKPAACSSAAFQVQRKCACGGSAGLSGSCSSCETEKLLGKRLQTKLRLSDPGDEFEQEADRAAEQASRMAEPGETEKLPLSPADPLVQRRVSGNTSAEFGAPPSVVETLSAPGHPLDQGTRTFFERRFNWDFSKVRVHADDRAARSAADLNALAYTLQNHVVFSDSQYRPHVYEGRQLLAHELAHVIQQSTTAPGSIQRLGRNDEEQAEAPDVDLRTALLAVDPVAVHLSDRDVQHIVEERMFRRFIVAHDLVAGWVEDENESWYVNGEELPDRSAKRANIVEPPANAEEFYDALASNNATARRVASTTAVDFTRLDSESLTESELYSLFDTGRFRAFVNFYSLTENFAHGQTGEIVEPENLDDFNRMRSRDRDATDAEVIHRFKDTLLGYLEPTLQFYEAHLTAAPPGIQLPQGVLDLFTLYLQTRSLENMAEALAVYFGASKTESTSEANVVASAISGLLRRVRSPRSAEAILSSQGARRATIQAVLDSLPESGQSVSSARPFEALEEIWGAIAATLLSDRGFSLNLLLSMPAELVNRIFLNRDNVAALVERIRGIKTPGEVYGLVHRFENSAADKEYLYRIIGIPESLVDRAAAPPPPVRQVCEACHEDPFDRAHPRPEGLDATQAEWRLALELAQARNSQAAWDTTVQILMVGGSIGAAVGAGALTGGLGWAAAAAAAGAGMAAAGTAVYEMSEALGTEQTAAGAHAASSLYSDFGLGSEGFLVWAERNLEHTTTGAVGNILVAIATAPIGGVEGGVIKKIMASMLMGGLDGLCSWMVDPRVNQADFLLESHLLSGGTAETAPTPTQTLVMSVGTGAFFGGLFEGGLQAGQRLFFHVEIGSGNTRITLEDGADVTRAMTSINQQLREGEPEKNVSRELVDEILEQSRRLKKKPLISIDPQMQALAEQIRHDGGILLPEGHLITIENNQLVRCSSCSVLSQVYHQILHSPESGALRLQVTELEQQVNKEILEALDEGFTEGDLPGLLASYKTRIDSLLQDIDTRVSRSSGYDPETQTRIRGQLAAVSPQSDIPLTKLLRDVSPEYFDLITKHPAALNRLDDAAWAELRTTLMKFKGLEAEARKKGAPAPAKKLANSLPGFAEQMLEHWYDADYRQGVQNALSNPATIEKAIRTVPVPKGRPAAAGGRKEIFFDEAWPNPGASRLDVYASMTDFTNKFPSGTCSPFDLRFGQERAAVTTGGGTELNALAEEMLTLGWTGDPIQVYFYEVEIGGRRHGMVFTYDHRRLIAAQSAATADPAFQIPFDVIAAATGIFHLDAGQTQTGGTTIKFF